MRRFFAWLRSKLRFSVSALLCVVVAINLVVYMNWLAKEPYRNLIYRGESFTARQGNRAPRYSENYTRVTNYRFGWPTQFIEVSKNIADGADLNSPLERHFKILSWKSAAITLGVSILLVAVYTWVLHRLLTILAPPSKEKKVSKRMRKAAKVEKQEAVAS